MIAWDNAKKPQKSERKEIERLEMPANSGEVRVRLIGEVMPRYVYWVTTKEGGKRPQECISYDRDGQEFNNKESDPFKEIPTEVYSEKPNFAYVCNVIDRRDGKIKLFDLKRTVYTQIVDFARNAEYGNPAHPDTGYDLIIKKEKTGPLAQNVRYTVTPSRNTIPLTEDEKKLELFDLKKMYKKPTYEEQKKWLLDNTNYFAGTAGDDFQETAEDLEG